jgi:hypothetical protein
VDAAPAGSLVESRFGLTGHTFELTTLLVQKCPGQLDLHVPRQPGPSHRMKPGEMGFMLCREGRGHV